MYDKIQWRMQRSALNRGICNISKGLHSQGLRIAEYKSHICSI